MRGKFLYLISTCAGLVLLIVLAMKLPEKIDSMPILHQMQTRTASSQVTINKPNKLLKAYKLLWQKQSVNRTLRTDSQAFQAFKQLYFDTMVTETERKNFISDIRRLRIVPKYAIGVNQTEQQAFEKFLASR